MKDNILGRNLTYLRKNAGFTRDKMAELLETSKFTYRKWEYGENEPNVDTLIKLGRIFNVSIDELVGNSKDGMQLALLEEKQ